MLQTKPTQLETETIRLDNILGYISLAGLVVAVVVLLLILLLLVHVVLLLPIVLAVLLALVALRFPLGVLEVAPRPLLCRRPRTLREGVLCGQYGVCCDLFQVSSAFGESGFLC